MTGRCHRPIRRSLPGAEHGFSLIELMIVIVIAASISAITTPTLVEKRKGANEEAAIGALRTITTAQTLFKEGDEDGNGVADYAPTLHALATAGLIPPSLATGRDHGYLYNITATEDRMHWSGTAVPAAIDRSGDHVFATDDTEVEITDCPPGQQLNPLTGKCESDDSYVHDLGIRFIHSVDGLSFGTALPTAKFFVPLVSDLTQQAAMAMDANHDGMLSFDESLNPDLLGPTLRPLLVSLTDALRRDLALGVANEQLPAVPIPMVVGDLLGYLNEVPPFVPGSPGSAKTR